MKTDEYNEVINHQDTYEDIASTLESEGRVVIGWSDEQGTHFDLLFNIEVPQFGSLQGGQRGMTDLFVTILGRGGFGFTKTETETHAGYIAGKFGGGLGSTAEKLAELINRIRKELNKK